MDRKKDEEWGRSRERSIGEEGGEREGGKGRVRGKREKVARGWRKWEGERRCGEGRGERGREQRFTAWVHTYSDNCKHI